MILVGSLNNLLLAEHVGPYYVYLPPDQKDNVIFYVGMRQCPAHQGAFGQVGPRQ